MDENKLKAEKKLRRSLTKYFLCYDETLNKHVIVQAMSSVACKNMLERFLPDINYIGEISHTIAWELYRTYETVAWYDSAFYPF